MFTIGEFSKLCMVTTKTLRHYDASGLLKPAFINEETGYRYYESAQFHDMLLIQKLKGYGCSLEEISQLLHCEPHVLNAHIASKYSLKKAELQSQKELLLQMKADLERLQKGMDIMSEVKTEIKVMELPEMNIVSARDTIAIEHFDVLYNRAFDLITAHNLKCIGPVVAIYHCEEFDPSNTDVEVGFIVDQSNEYTRLLKGGTCAVGIHLGSYSNLNKTYTAVAEWIEKNGYRIADKPFERYLNSPHEVSEDKLVTEVCFPIQKV